MWAVLIAFTIVGGLVTVAYREATDPVIKPDWQKLKLARLASIPIRKLTLDQAEDGVVLSRRLGEHDLERHFAIVTRELKTKRLKV